MSDRKYTAGDFARALDPMKRKLEGALRRLGVDITKITKVAGWKLLGFDLDGGQESVTAEIYPGVGFYSRPPTGVKADAIVANIQGAEHPAIIATRDEKTRKASAGSLAEDETAIFNTKVTLYLKADGTIEARTVGGVAVALALKSDVQNVVDKYNTHLHVAAGALTGTPVVGPLPGTPATAPNPVGTTKLKGE